VSATSDEIGTQPELWRLALASGRQQSQVLPPRGASVATIGCGTSFHIARAWALAREAAGHGTTKAFPASEARPAGFDHAICISRSGTTSEVLWAMEDLPRSTRTLAITAVADSPLAERVDDAIVLEYADERSVMQTRWATCVLAMLRGHIGDRVEDLVPAAREAVLADLPLDATGFIRFVFLGRGWAAGLADEAALKFREGAGAWSESYPSMEYRHGPMSVGAPTLVWSLDRLDPRLHADIARSGATVIANSRDPMVELLYVQRAAVELAERRGLDPDMPNHLSRSVVLA
jgi:fructoselysine-6-P-deglycase FrlB-like protein